MYNGKSMQICVSMFTWVIDKCACHAYVQQVHVGHSYREVNR